MESVSSSRLYSDGIAPMASLELVLVGRPFKVMSLLASGVACLNMVVSTASSRWMIGDNVRAGLWEECVTNSTGQEELDCSMRPLTKAYSQVSTAFALFGIISAVAATVIMCMGMTSKDLRFKFRMYNITLLLQVIGVICFLVPLVTYPLRFMQRVAAGVDGRQIGIWWVCGWPYACGWAGIISLVASAFLLYLDKPSEEVVYREKITKGSCLIET